ncbi:GntT/GntP/DsdX family permease [Rhodospirillum rubrum]|uniref:Gluconate transporter n=1 Tax=Rhodospirillum rubrum (strain ATCC 11170 / ATH 1.1.1 / DSM 467 / LMG 4362 / NCIMB 8255 / S1) TaxID=269796 RepID=Q2RPL0_RHORT|nr:gluconate:H+ symporter [Rhodospirillum rubrum]ABC23935.1 Gluconate transporter [Rhodospirillum rubrum ATCC 11170]AEO49679.1 gluconate transporter [Rhodospirillum rubrum F11]MBK5955594.1 permease DsdX [Rhodospirillum rubrum]QXG79879.1 GntP family permease [Rhodospirillum rubrum]HAP99323.1 permease DsdX [Rhodospirillum rubrum]
MHPDTTLILIAAASIVLLVLLVTRLKLHPFLALMVAAAFLGLASGLAPTDAVKTFQKGFGNILGSVGLVVGLGSMLGGLLLNTGGADRIANAFVGRGSTVWLPTSICAAALLIGMPHLFDVSFVMLVPLVFAIAKRTGSHLMRVGLPMAAGLYVSHGFLLPHPSPTLALAIYHGDAGRAILFGFLLAIPTAILSGPLLTSFAMRWFKDPIDITHSPIMTAAGRSDVTTLDNAPRLPVVLLTVLLPPGLMLLRTLLADHVPEGAARAFLDGIGNPIVSLAIAVLFAIWALGVRSGRSLGEIQKLLGKSLAPAAGVILIVGAGGGLKEMLLGTHIGDMIASGAAQWAISPLVLAWVIAALMRIAVGSATVATVTAAGLMAPVQALHPEISPELMTISVATGGLMLSHLNDSGFWLFKEYFQLTVAQTLKSWTLMVSVQSALGLAGVLLIDAVIR